MKNQSATSQEQEAIITECIVVHSLEQLSEDQPELQRPQSAAAPEVLHTFWTPFPLQKSASEQKPSKTRAIKPLNLRSWNY